MSSDSAAREAASAGAAPVRVLFFGNASGGAPGWARGDSRPLDVRVAPRLRDAPELLGRGGVDVVVVDASLAAAQATEIGRLCGSLDHVSLLVQADDLAPEIAPVLEVLRGRACLLPATAPPSIQAKLVEFAADRARLSTALHGRIAELEQLSRELGQSESRFRDVIEHNADAILVVDTEGVIRFANGIAAGMFGSPAGELCGRTFGFPVVAGETTELDLLHPGESRVVEMRVVESEWEGETACIASLRDITERKRAEADARRLVREQAARASAEMSARRSRFLAEASTVLSVPLSYTATLATLGQLCVRHLADWAVVYTVNDCGVVQRLDVAHRGTAEGEAAKELLDHPIRAAGEHPVLEVLRTRVPRLVPCLHEDELVEIADDERHLALLRRLGVVSYMLVPLIARDRQLGAIGLVSSNRDHLFTEEDLAEVNDLALRAALAADNARLYEEAQRSNQAKTDLLAVISHDLRTPLNSIIGHADLLAMGIPDQLSDGGRERVERIRVGATHLIYLIDQLLSFARLDAGHEELHFEEVDAVSIMHDVAAVVEPLAVERNLRFVVEAPSPPVALWTDADRLRQVLLNLVGNAFKYTEQGEVRLELVCSAEHAPVAFHVRDTGIGIRPEHLEQIFQPFWQADPAQRANRGGTGLGLSVVQRLARLLGAKLSVESEVGRGSTFTLAFPAASPPAAR